MLQEKHTYSLRPNRSEFASKINNFSLNHMKSLYLTTVIYKHVYFMLKPKK